MESNSNVHGAEIQALRRKLGLTQKQLGQLVKVSPMHISQMENGRKNPSPALLEALRALAPKEPSGPSIPGSAQVLLEEIRAARQEMGQPVGAAEAAVLAGIEPEDLLTQSILLREALEVQASRELLAGAKAFRKKRESARNGS